jgi:outer membrane protein insertion porin family
MVTRSTPDSVLAKIVNIKRGEVYNQKILDERIFMNPNGGDLSSLYMDDGYLFFGVTPMEVMVEGDSIDLELRINEGAQATIREVRILGNTKTNEKVIRRELRTLPGNKFSRNGFDTLAARNCKPWLFRPSTVRCGAYT